MATYGATDNTTPVRVALLGATGRVGGWVLEECLERGFQVRALVRKVEKLQKYSNRISLFQGDATDAKALEQLITSGDNQPNVIISTIGSPSNDTLVVEKTAKALVTALALCDDEIPRIIWMTSTGINEATDQAKSYPCCWKPNHLCCGYGLFGWLQFKILIPCIIGKDLWNDMGLSEDVIRQKESIAKRTVIVRPCNMKPVSEKPTFSQEWREEGGDNTSYVFVAAQDPPPGIWICRRAVAVALVDLVQDTSHDGTAVSLFEKVK